MNPLQIRHTCHSESILCKSLLWHGLSTAKQKDPGIWNLVKNWVNIIVIRPKKLNQIRWFYHPMQSIYLAYAYFTIKTSLYQSRKKNPRNMKFCGKLDLYKRNKWYKFGRVGIKCQSATPHQVLWPFWTITVKINDPGTSNLVKKNVGNHNRNKFWNFEPDRTVINPIEFENWTKG